MTLVLVLLLLLLLAALFGSIALFAPLPDNKVDDFFKYALGAVLLVFFVIIFITLNLIIGEPFSTINRSLNSV